MGPLCESAALRDESAWIQRAAAIARTEAIDRFGGSRGLHSKGSGTSCASVSPAARRCGLELIQKNEPAHVQDPTVAPVHDRRYRRPCSVGNSQTPTDRSGTPAETDKRFGCPLSEPTHSTTRISFSEGGIGRDRPAPHVGHNPASQVRVTVRGCGRSLQVRLPRRASVEGQLRRLRGAPRARCPSPRPVRPWQFGP